MTVYLSDTPYEAKPGDPRFFLWSDHPDEALGICYAIGAPPVPSEWHNSWECYLLTGAEFAEAAVIPGVTITDRYGPALWCLKRDGMTQRWEALNAARNRWLASRG